MTTDDPQDEERARFAEIMDRAGYELGDLLGKGGMAEVYRARQKRPGRMVALKRIAPGLAAIEDFKRRFLRESQQAAAVDHARILPVFDANEFEGTLYIAMRLVTGGSVADLIEHEGKLPPDGVVKIVSQVAEGLDAAHAKGLIHRDVKPGNMLIETPGVPDDIGNVYLADFGISKDLLESTPLTHTGIILGTYHYSSPEQLSGGAVDGQADQYSLGCSAYAMLSGGHPPFERPTVKAQIAAHLAFPPPDLTKTWRLDLSPDVDAVFTKVLAKEPHDRYGSCREFAEALAVALAPAAKTVNRPDPLPIPAPPPDHDPRQREGTGRRRPVVTGVAAGIVALGIAGGVAYAVIANMPHQSANQHGSPLVRPTLTRTATHLAVPSVTSLAIKPGRVTVREGHQVTVTLTGLLSDGSTAPPAKLADARWSSPRHRIATVHDGRITGRGPGSTEVRARLGPLVASVAVHVPDEPTPHQDSGAPGYSTPYTPPVNTGGPTATPTSGGGTTTLSRLAQPAAVPQVTPTPSADLTGSTRPRSPCPQPRKCANTGGRPAPNTSQMTALEIVLRHIDIARGYLPTVRRALGGS